MLTEADLLEAITAAPDDDDGPRLVYADWLQERAAPRGELIQVQCALARLDRGDARWSPLRRREAELLRAHQTTWLAALAPKRLERFSFRRGMVETGSIDSARLTQALRSAAPTLRELTISCAPAADEVAVASSPHLARITELGLTSPSGITAAGVSAALGSVHLRALQRLHLRVDSSGAAALGDAPQGVQSLALNRGRGALDPAWEPRLGRSDLAAGLTRLQLHGVALGAGGARVIAESARFAGLNDLGVFTDDLGPEGILALLGSPHLGGLRRLTLSQAGTITSEAFSRCAWLGRLGALRLTDCGPAAAALLAMSDVALDQLDLSGNGLGDAAIEALARWPPLARITRLYLARNTISDRGARALAASPHLGPLTELLLHGNAIGDDGVAALAAADRLSRLAWLTLGTNRIGDGGAKAIAGSPHLARVTRLSLFGNTIGAEGATALAGSEHLDPVELSVDAGVGDAAIELLRGRFGAALSVGGASRR